MPEDRRRREVCVWTNSAPSSPMPTQVPAMRSRPTLTATARPVRTHHGRQASLNGTRPAFSRVSSRSNACKRRMSTSVNGNGWPVASANETARWRTSSGASANELLTLTPIPITSRSGGRVATTREVRRPARVDTVTLVGTLQSGNGWVAFFDGSGADYRKALNAQGRIAGYTITQVAFNSVQLEAKDKKLSLRVGHSLRRENGGEWKVSTGSGMASTGGGSTSASRYDRNRTDRSREAPRTDGRETTEAAPADAESPADVVSDAVDEVLRRLMEQREREDR